MNRFKRVNNFLKSINKKLIVWQNLSLNKPWINYTMFYRRGTSNLVGIMGIYEEKEENCHYLYVAFNDKEGYERMDNIYNFSFDDKNKKFYLYEENGNVIILKPVDYNDFKNDFLQTYAKDKDDCWFCF